MRNAGTVLAAGIVFVLVVAGAVSADEYDKSLFPKAYGVLATESLLFPVEMGNWPVKIDSRHQLFVDDCLIKSMSGLSREFHKFSRHPGNPLWTPPKRMSMLLYVMRTDEGKFRLWYAQRVKAKNADGVIRRHPTAYLESDDGVNWRAPNLGVVMADGNTDNNYVFRKSLEGIFYEPREKDPSRRFKALAHLEPDNDKTPDLFEGYWLYVSADGIHWTLGRHEPVATSLVNYGIPQTGIGDTSSWRWDSVLKKYICNTKFVLSGKYRAYGICESEDLIHWSRPRMMFYRDARDPAGMQFYAHHTFNYESMWFGLIKTMEIFQPKDKSGHWKHCELQLSMSRDGRHYTRCPDRSPVLPIPENGLDMDYPCVATGSPIRMGNELWFYYADRRHGNRPGPRPTWEKGKADLRLFVATLRVDGFASLNAGDKPGRVVTRPLTFEGKTLFVNVEVGEGGYVKAELRKAFPETGRYIPRGSRKPIGDVIEPYALKNCSPVTGNVMAAPITWQGKDSIEHPAGTSPRLVFELKNAKLYSFWLE